MESYYGAYRSAIARARRILMRAGLPWSVTTGRYSPFSETQKTSPGVRVTRVGCSDTISLSVWGMTNRPTPETRDLQRRALEALREAGMPFDDRGWLDCRTERARKQTPLVDPTPYSVVCATVIKRYASADAARAGATKTLEEWAELGYRRQARIYYRDGSLVDVLGYGEAKP